MNPTISDRDAIIGVLAILFFAAMTGIAPLTLAGQLFTFGIQVFRSNPTIRTAWINHLEISRRRRMLRNGEAVIY